MIRYGARIATSSSTFVSLPLLPFVAARQTLSMRKGQFGDIGLTATVVLFAASFGDGFTSRIPSSMPAGTACDPRETLHL
jgi:hypothetical protein